MSNKKQCTLQFWLKPKTINDSTSTNLVNNKTDNNKIQKNSNQTSDDNDSVDGSRVSNLLECASSNVYQTNGDNNDEVSSTFVGTKTNQDYSFIQLNPCFEKINSVIGKGRKLIRCKICLRNQNIVLKHTKLRNKIPPICSEGGTVPRTAILEAHLTSIEHTESVKVDHLRTLSKVELTQCAPLDKIFSNQNSKRAQQIAKYMCTVFNDAMRGTLSAWSWPSREIAFMKRQSLDINKPCVKFTVNEGDLLYITPSNHNEMLNCIVNSDFQRIQTKLKTCLAISLRVDGSVDRTQVDNIHVMAKIITAEANVELIFIGFEEPESKGAGGYYNAIKKCIERFMPWTDFHKICSSIVTDGASINTGSKNGLWNMFNVDKQNDKCPLIKVWCAVHRSALAWEYMTSNVVEIKKMIELCSSISTFFHRSGLRSKELQQIANDNKISFIRLPKYYEVRWTEFTYGLLYAILINWRILVHYFLKQIKDKTDQEHISAGYLKFLTDFDKLKLLCLVTDLGYLYSRFQKLIQGDNILMFDIEDQLNLLKNRIRLLQKSALPGGWEEKLNNESICYDASIGHYKLNGIDIFKTTESSKSHRRKIHHLYINDRKSFEAIKNETYASILNFLEDRFNSLEWDDLKPLKILNENISDIELKKCHSIICPDYPLLNFLSSYREATSSSYIENKNISVDLLKVILKCEDWEPLAISIARVLAIKPHSADVERLISYYNILKSHHRSSLSPETIKNCLHVKINMCTLSEFDPREAVLYWLNLKNRHDKAHPLAEKQSWYQGVFREADSETSMNKSESKQSVRF